MHLNDDFLGVGERFELLYPFVDQSLDGGVLGKWHDPGPRQFLKRVDS
jgi:hypothetical protein